MNESWKLATIRHAETDYNGQNRYAGTIDIPLNDAGRNDARYASAKIKSMLFDTCIVSPFKRAIETAQILTEGQIQTIPCDYVRERNYGILQGKTIVDVEFIRPPIHFIKFGGDYHSINPPEAETFEEVRERAKMFLHYILDSYQGRRILLVSHGTFLQQFHGLLRGMDWIESLGTRVDNLELTTFHFDGDKVVSENHIHLMDRNHLDF